MVQTDALQFAGDTVQLETTFLGALHRSDAELLRHCVEQLTVLHKSDIGCI